MEMACSPVQRVRRFVALVVVAKIADVMVIHSECNAGLVSFQDRIAFLVRCIRWMRNLMQMLTMKA